MAYGAPRGADRPVDVYLMFEEHRIEQAQTRRVSTSGPSDDSARRTRHEYHTATGTPHRFARRSNEFRATIESKVHSRSSPLDLFLVSLEILNQQTRLFVNPKDRGAHSLASLFVQQQEIDD